MRKDNIFSKLIHIGIDDSIDFAESRRLKIVNLISIVCGLSWLGFSFLLLHLKFYSAFSINIFGSLACFLSLWLNHKRHTKLAFYSISIGTFIAIYILSLHYGRDSGVHYLLLFWAVITNFIFTKPLRSLPLFILGGASFAFLEYYFNNFTLFSDHAHNDHVDVSFIQYIVILTTLVSIRMVIQFFKIDTHLYETSLKEKNALLEQQKEEINSQNEQLEHQNTEIEQQNNQLHSAYSDVTSSVNYARRIQRAILIPQKIIKTAIPKMFILNKPKDIVSGDFYWFAQCSEQTILVVADCTGHGVPGAFMTAIGNTLLNQIVSENNKITPAEILTTLHVRLLETLNQEFREEKVNDGMDIAICAIHKKENTVLYAGAKRPLYKFNNKELTVYKSTNASIGGTQISTREFTNNIIPVSSGDRFYFFSDGYPDQFGGDKGKKLKIKYFNEVLLAVQNSDILSQKQLLKNHLEQWQRHYDQTDDILIIGFEV